MDKIPQIENHLRVLDKLINDLKEDNDKLRKQIEELKKEVSKIKK